MPSSRDRPPAVTVILPCYNVAPFFDRAIEQLAAQSITDLEILVIDDGSTDDTVARARRAAARDPRVRVIELSTNGGVAHAREAGVNAATAQWIWFVDADDAWPHDAAASLLANSEGADMVIGAAQYVYDTKPSRPLPAPRDRINSGRDAFAALLDGDITGHLWNKLFRRDLLQKVSFRASRVHSDLSIVAEATAACDSVAVTSKCVYSYQIRSGSVITSNTPRAASLKTVSDVVEKSARTFQHDKEIAQKLRYFEHRYILLSALKDAANPGYSNSDRRDIIASIRKDLRWKAVSDFASKRDFKRAAAVVAAKSSPVTAKVGAFVLSRR
ncbi:glycosyltransferase family 2 protein [Microbacterium paludicola]|uniref:glycosyltransferase family 2 protein n=1 Tax=Microbacterium paludicola TaxID=300019 RepID=UPI0011A639DC|nr:glycosyltransferase family 2 protein [Microbacterium paludicola]